MDVPLVMESLAKMPQDTPEQRRRYEKRLKEVIDVHAHEDISKKKEHELVAQDPRGPVHSRSPGPQKKQRRDHRRKHDVTGLDQAYANINVPGEFQNLYVDYKHKTLYIAGSQPLTDWTPAEPGGWVPQSAKDWIWSDGGMLFLPGDHTQRYQTAKRFLKENPTWDLVGHSLGARVALDLGNEIRDKGYKGHIRLYNVPAISGLDTMPSHTDAFGDLLDPVSGLEMESHGRLSRLSVPHSYK